MAAKTVRAAVSIAVATITYALMVLFVTVAAGELAELILGIPVRRGIILCVEAGIFWFLWGSSAVAPVSVSVPVVPAPKEEKKKSERKPASVPARVSPPMGGWANFEQRIRDGDREQLEEAVKRGEEWKGREVEIREVEGKRW
ncbi:hypothetical protein DM02DRAFT_669458 [Periconia macrospinosa]|uniref:Uncharacterized protein n=1 Tax=Periconia macrospinosa TaxID=97972 RepID=A0A2V1E2L4_9PLEO|nr:hypothetical protein DM02DRAFT_669458 [Periconia macrospinosa]